MQLPIGLSLANARRAYRRRMFGAMLLGVASFGVFVALTRGPLIYDFREPSFAAASGIVERCDYKGCDTPLEVTYYDNYFVDQYVDIEPDDCCYHPGQTLTVYYDPTGECQDVAFGNSDVQSGIIGDIVVLTLIPIVVAAIIGWHARRWRRRAERAAAEPVAPGWSAVRIPSRTRRPLFRLTPDSTIVRHGGLQFDLVMAGLRRQLTTAIGTDTRLEVLGRPEEFGVVALRVPESPLIIWPAGRLRDAWLAIDRYDIARLSSYAIPPLAGVLWHALAGHPSC